MKRLSEPNRNILISALAFGLAYYYFPRLEIVIIGAVYLFLCLLVGKVKLANHQFWIWLTKILQTITSPILFGAIFFLILTPISLAFRLFRKEREQKDSTFDTIERKVDEKFFEVPW